METKSRYEVISDLENKKRILIDEKNSFEKQLFIKNNNIKNKERAKEDTIRDIDRDIADAKDELKEFIESKNARADSINEMINSINDSLERFNQTKS